MKILVSILLIASLAVGNINSLNSHGLETTSFSKEEWNQIIESIELTVLTEEPSKQDIACFDISEQGLIALGFNTSPKKTVLVYDSSGVFLYGFRFSSSGSIGVAFVEENIAIYFARSNLVATYAQNGECIALENVLSTQNNSEPKQELMYATKKEVNGSEYRLERDIGIIAQSYSRLVVTDDTGVEQILYDVTLQHNISIIMVGGLVLATFGLLLTYVVKRTRKGSERR